MDNLTFQKLKDTISASDSIAIAVGKNADVDDMAGALTLYLAFKKLGKNPVIVSATQPLVEHSNLVGIDKVSPQLGNGNGDLTVSFPYREGEIEKVSYTIDNGFLNIVVKAGQNGLTFEQQDVRFARGGSVPSALFIIGTPRLSDLGDLFNPESLKNTKIVNIDNKQENQGYGDVTLVSQSSSSVSEVVGEMLLTLSIDLDQDSAQNLLIGIMQETANLQDPKTSPLAFEMVGQLLKKGAKRPDISRPAQPQQQNEERVSSFMPEQSLAGMGNTSVPRPKATLSQNGVQDAQKPPSDWLTPKVYKGSSSV